ncbi:MULTISPECIES: phage/plasmid primase, P4 family [Nitrosomonas]|uniref:Putative DNA primase/helicase n=1 Tax=Nitrosomonas communis TaxID=44574 RepID=A0A0F7KB16_9PROT|nr:MULTISPECIES: phage/plasmid primase, P4 family [Nitrosomonas]AKH37560.1 hypothetical protein AAW31_06590 [Nitrosomonas communis]TYP78479.1 putative DNA primase/helicase [Nitrosomonas communis]UVS62821.1 phage/plasmid primase, P4 family [Nitrosomonas sp. PLL12]
MLDFNNEPPLTSFLSGDFDQQRATIRAELLTHLEAVLFTLYPAGKKRRDKFLIGDILGSPGDSLEVVLEGSKAGLWTDRANNSGGDIFALIGGYYGINLHTDFPRVLAQGADLLGRSHLAPVPRPMKEPPLDDLGPATAKWDYLDASGKLITVVYRYDPPGRKKEFRPWDARRRKNAPPEPRPLYNQPGIAKAEQVILVEGEKCAQALINLGIVATTAMHGANAPVDKTDWSPLAGKTVLIWPDRDIAGWNYAEAAAKAVLAAGAISCDILMPPDTKPEGWDAADALAERQAERSDEDPSPFDVPGFILAGQRMPVMRDLEAPMLEESSDDLTEGVSWSTEDGLATAFTHRYSEDWRYCAQWSKWLVWTGQRWNEDRVLFVNHLARGICRSASRKADSPRLKAKLASASTIAAVERIVRAEPKHATTADEWDADLWLLNTPGGVIDLRTGALHAHQRAHRMTKITTATIQGGCPQWLAFLEQITDGDSQLQAYLQRVAGYCLTGSTQEHGLFFLYGTGSNGKSVFVNTLFTLLGDYAANAPMETFMETRTERHPTDLAGLRGARLVTATETEQGRRWNEAKIKEITGGDRVTARFMRQDYFTYSPQFKLMISGNHKPAIKNVDEAMKRRLHLIPFTVTIPAERRDRELASKLLKERDGILAWALAGCLTWQREGLQPPESVQRATAEYFEAEDAMGRWMDERCLLHANAKSLTIELFNDWKQWADNCGEFIGSQRRFSDQLLSKGLQKWRNNFGVRGFQGIGLKETPQQRYPYAND